MNWTHTFGTHCIYVLKKSGSVYDIPPHVFVPPKHIVTTKLAARQQTPWKLKTVKSHHVTTHAYFYVPAKSPCANTAFELYAIMTLYKAATSPNVLLREIRQYIHTCKTQD